MTTGRIIEDEAELAQLVRGLRTVAVLGMKDQDSPDASAYTIPKMLKHRGLRVIPVNPKLAGKEVFGEPALAALSDLPVRPDVVDVFRRSEVIPEVADAVLALPDDRRPPVVWLQSGIQHDQATARLTQAGVDVVVDRCLGVYTSRYHPAPEAG